MDIASSIELVTRLTEVGAIDIAGRFQAEVERTRRYMQGRLCAEIQFGGLTTFLIDQI